MTARVPLVAEYNYILMILHDMISQCLKWKSIINSTTLSGKLQDETVV